MKHAFTIFITVMLACFLITGAGYAEVDPKSPILLIASDNRFGSYTSEILRTEGFNEFRMDSLTNDIITISYLKKFEIVVLTETPLTRLQKEMFEYYVKGGGNLIAFRPDKKLNEIFGLIDTKKTIHEAWLSIDTLTEIGKGLTNETLQFHGMADQYLIKNGKKIATIFSDAFASTEFPAVVMNDYGKGHAIAFLYNLPESIVYTRQGNYMHAGEEMDGINGIRAMDMFTDGWIDTTKNTLNQADEQMQLFTHCLEKITAIDNPLPRFWYFPDDLKCLVVLNNDGEDSYEADFIPHFKDIESKDAKMTLYVLEVDKVSKTAIDSWKKNGHEISGHVDDTKEAVNPTWVNMNTAISTKINELNSRYGIEKMRTVVNHWFVWCGKDQDGSTDFAAQAILESNHGIELDANYAHYDNNSRQGHFLGSSGTNQGNFTGSGLPMKFAGKTGSVLNIYQLLNNVYDQQYMENKDQEGFFNCFKGLMDRSLNKEIYSYITVKTHTNEYFFSKKPLSEMLDYAKQNGIPVWTAIELLDFLKTKDEAEFTNIHFSNNRLSFDIHSTLKHRSGLTCMIPYAKNEKKINRITINGKIESYNIKSAKGYRYAFVTISPGANYTLVADYNNNLDRMNTKKN
jgi:hypothetical protein